MYSEEKWTEFRREVEALSTSEKERKRIADEFALFEERGWEKYVLLLAAVMKASGNRPYFGEGGSACDSCVLDKCRKGNDGGRKLLSDRRGREILFNDALRLTYHIEWPHNDYTDDSVKKLDSILDPIVRTSGLFVTQKLFSYSPVEGCDNLKRRRVEYIVLSDTPLGDEDFALILNERRESTAEEAERLRKYLIIRVTVDWYKGPEGVMRAPRSLS